MNGEVQSLVTCPHCGRQFNESEYLSHWLRENVRWFTRELNAMLDDETEKSRRGWRDAERDGARGSLTISE